MTNKDYLRQELGKDLKFNEPLKKHTWVRIGGPAEFFYYARDLDDLKKSIKIAQDKRISHIVIGSGSNIVVSDQGFKGLVIKNEAAKLVFERNLAFVESGITLYSLIRKLAESNVGGLEFLAGIPGTLGGAVYGNAGAYGKCMADLVKNITILDVNGDMKQISDQDFNFKYRESILKARAKIDQDYHHRPVILSACLKTRPNNRESILRVVENYIKIKTKKIPTEPSAGCIFKNIVISNTDSIDPQLKIFAIDNKIPAGLLIDKVGAKSVRVGALRVSEKHANFIINNGRGKAVDYLVLADKIRQIVKEKFGLKLEEEIEYVGIIDTQKKGLMFKIFKKKKKNDKVKNDQNL